MTSVSLSRCYAWTFQPDGEERVNNERQSDHSVSERSVGYGVNHTYLQWLTGCRPGSWVLSLTSSDRRWRWRRRTEAERGYRVEIMSPSVPTLQQQQQRRSRHVIIAIITIGGRIDFNGQFLTARGRSDYIENESRSLWACCEAACIVSAYEADIFLFFFNFRLGAIHEPTAVKVLACLLMLFIVYRIS